MKLFLNLSTRNKLFLAFTIMIALIGLIILIAYSNIESVRESQKSLYTKNLTIANNLTQFRASINLARVLFLNMLLTKDRLVQENLRQQIDVQKRLVDSLLTEIIAISRDDAVLLSKITELKSILEEFQKTREQLIDLIFRGKTNEAQNLSAGIQADRYEKTRLTILELEKMTKQNAEASIQKSDEIINHTIRVFIIIGLAAVLTGTLFTIYLNKIIAVPLKEISTATNKISSGDLTIKIPTDNRLDEIGILADNFMKMVNNLQSIIKEIYEGVNVLGSSASEILATTAQIASGAAETATSISETTATVEEVKQTAQVSSQKAKYVLENSQKASQISQIGKKSVEESIEVMNKIKEQMEFVAEGIVRLSEQSQAIGEIIAAVNDLADQSNLLAVNAAIEAAKAGEQGKGFTVVAQEIKSLAEQSRQATTQVRSILGDIQKAMSSAVLATEQASKAVEAGVKQSAEAGNSIRVLTESITEASQASTQIAASSQQQSVGMDQIAQAMENIKQASSQTAAGTKQAENAAKDLNELGTKLKEVIQQFKI